MGVKVSLLSVVDLGPSGPWINWYHYDDVDLWFDIDTGYWTVKQSDATEDWYRAESIQQVLVGDSTRVVNGGES